MNYTLNEYLLLVGLLGNETTVFTSKQFLDNIDYFENCYNQNIEAQVAVRYFWSYLETKIYL